MSFAPDEREFAVFGRGDRREEILSSFRIGAREYTNPSTGQPFTEPEIATATADGSRLWIEADAIDLVLLAEQNRALWLSDQVRPDHASTGWLRGPDAYHRVLWGMDPLFASGGSGAARFEALGGTVFAGSTTVGDPAARTCTDPAGLRYQVQITTETPPSGVVDLVLIAVDTGTATNIAADTVLTWSNPPVNAQPRGAALAPFTGGTADETDAEYARRLMSRIRHKPAAGNAAQFRVWARDSTNAVEDAFVYPCAMHAGSTLVCVTQKRAGVEGPAARLASASTLQSATGYLVPRSSPVVPARAHVVVTTPTPVKSDLVISMAMPAGKSSGWADRTPWPTPLGADHVSGTVATSTWIFYSDAAAMPSGVTVPKVMAWDAARSRWESLVVDSVGSYLGTPMIFLAQETAIEIGTPVWLSPDTAKREIIAEAVEGFFDAVGPGEVIDLASDDRAHRAFRFPQPNEEYPFRPGSSIVSRLGEAMGYSLANATVTTQSVVDPGLPSDPNDGPKMLVAGNVAIYPEQ